MTAIIIGATSGIGASYARALAAEGYDLILTGRREPELRSVADGLRTDHSVSVLVRILELKNPAEVAEFSDFLGHESEIYFLVNSAGYGTVSPFLGMDIEKSVDMLRVHNEAPMRFCKAVISQMVARGKGYVVNVSSIAGFMPAPASQVYTSTKSALTVFSEALALALRKHGVHVQALCPGFTRTDFHSKLEQVAVKVWERPGVHWMSSDDVVKSSIKAVFRRGGLCIPGFRNKLIYSGVKLMPRKLYYKLALRIGG